MSRRISLLLLLQKRSRLLHAVQLLLLTLLVLERNNRYPLVQLSHAFTISSWIRPLTRIFPLQLLTNHHEKLPLQLERNTDVRHQEQETLLVGTMDTETRRKKRLERLSRPPNSSMLDAAEVGFLQHNLHHVLKKTSPTFQLGENYMMDLHQHNSILSDAPAILLQSGAGTGKTTVLAGRIAYLLKTKQVEPKNMIILSFTRRDAEALKDKALEILFNNVNNGNNGNEGVDSMPQENVSFTRDSLKEQLWCGTIHSFAINILKKYNFNNVPLRIISTQEMKTRVRNCLGRIHGSDKHRMMLYKAAMEQSKQSIGTLVNDVIRCLELWKEAGVLFTPYAYTIHNLDVKPEQELSQDDYVELAMRLGISQEVARLALDISGDYQAMHAGSGTADPSDVAQMAYDFLINHPKVLNSVRSKLKQVILDEYQDVSVSQHKLLRIIVRGADDGNLNPVGVVNEKAKLPVLLDHKTVPNAQVNSGENICFQVPKIICAGDANQSIYGWRGAAPSLTVEGFRADFPQGLIIPLGTNYRLPKHILNAANVLIGDQKFEKVDNYSMFVSPKSFDVSPAALTSMTVAVSNYTCPTTSDDGNEAIAPSSLTELPQLLLEEALMSESRSSVFIQGLWDQREEAKFIAGEIRKRSKARSELFTKVRQNFKANGECLEESTFYDSTDVAIMVRSKGQLKLIEEALTNYRIPYTMPKEHADDGTESSLLSSVKIIRNPTLLPMKPVKLITMHMAKGDEFDDVYLASWTEGVFPHPSSLSSNRLYEERRIAYVALTRARQRVVITYSFMKRVSYYGSNGTKKDVTEPVEPSRFLYDLMDISDGTDPNEKEFINWSESYGFKEIVASTNLPKHFSKSYQIPNGYTKDKAPKKLPSSPSVPLTATKKATVDLHTPGDAAEMKSVLNEIESGMQAVFANKRGAKGKYRKIFRSILHTLGIGRGSALVLTKEGRKILPESIDILGKAPECYTTTRPLSRCTSEQLGLYLFCLIHKKRE